MDLHTISNIYNKYDDVISDVTGINMNNRLLLTFIPQDALPAFVDDISSQYSILYNKIFVFNIGNEEEYGVTYNLDHHNLTTIPTNTILVHRKKQSNTLYTINALNELIKSLNGGELDKHFRINWNDYRNTIILTQNGELTFLKTKIADIITTG